MCVRVLFLVSSGYLYFKIYCHWCCYCFHYNSLSLSNTGYQAIYHITFRKFKKIAQSKEALHSRPHYPGTQRKFAKTSFPIETVLVALWFTSLHNQYVNILKHYAQFILKLIKYVRKLNDKSRPFVMNKNITLSKYWTKENNSTKQSWNISKHCNIRKKWSLKLMS